MPVDHLLGGDVVLAVAVALDLALLLPEFGLVLLLLVLLLLVLLLLVLLLLLLEEVDRVAVALVVHLLQPLAGLATLLRLQVVLRIGLVADVAPSGRGRHVRLRVLLRGVRLFGAGALRLSVSL